MNQPPAAVADRTADLVAIQQVLHRYPHAVDDRDWDAFSAIFAVDATCDMRAVGLGVTGDRAALVACFAAIDHPVAHHLMDPVIDVTGRDAAHVRSKWLVVLADRSSLSGLYTDEMVRTPDGWRVRARVITTREEGSRRPVPGYSGGSS